MAYKDLRAFCKLLERKKHLLRVPHSISAELEISQITDRMCKGPLAENKALLFENVRGSGMPVLINLFGHPERMAWALGLDSLDQLHDDLADLIDLRLPQGLGAALNRGRSLLSALQSIGLKPNFADSFKTWS